jgi:hypothetical protein
MSKDYSDKEYDYDDRDPLTGKIIAACYQVHNELGPGFVELKALEGRMPKVFESQVVSYLKAAGLNVGLLINFGNRRCEIRRLMTSP